MLARQVESAEWVNPRLTYCNNEQKLRLVTAWCRQILAYQESLLLLQCISDEFYVSRLLAA